VSLIVVFSSMLGIALSMATEVATVAEAIRSASSLAFSFCEASEWRVLDIFVSQSMTVVALKISSNAVNVSVMTVSWFSVRFSSVVEHMELIRFVLKLLLLFLVMNFKIINKMSEGGNSK